MSMENLFGKKEKKFWFFIRKKKNVIWYFFWKNYKFFCLFWKNGKKNGFRKFLKETGKKILF